MTSAWAWFSAPWAESLTIALLHFLWLGALWTALGVIAVRCWGTTSAAKRYVIWLAVLVLMAVSPAVTAWWLQSTESPVEMSAAETALDSQSADMNAFVVTTVNVWITTVPSTDALHAWQPYVLIGWLTGVLLSGLRLLLSTCWIVHITRRLTEWPEEWQTRAKRLGRRLSLARMPRLGLSMLVSEPMAVRLWRPAVILPASWLSEMPADMIEAVLAHELSHIRRHDLWINLLQRVIETLLFFHPCVWWVSRQIRLERELCCDALAVSATGRAVEYARALEWVATWRLASAGPLLATGLGGTRMVLLQRVRKVLGLDSAEAASSGWTWGATGIGALAVCVTVLMLWSVPVQGDDDPPSGSAPSNVADFDSALKALDSAFAQRDGDEPRPPQPPRRPEPPRDGDRRPEGGPRDGDRPREAGPRDGDRRPDGPRDGERRPDAGPRDGDRRPEGGPRDGDRRPDAGPRGERGPQPPRDGDRRPDGPREGGPRDGDFRGIPPEAMQDMMRAMQELRAEVQRLRAEVNELRAQRGPGPQYGREGGPREGGPRPAGDFGPGRGDGPRPGEGRPGPQPGIREGDLRGREPGRPGSPEGRPGPRPEGERRPDGERRPEGERRPGAEGERRPERPEGERGQPPRERTPGERD